MNHHNRPSLIIKARTIGILFILAFLAYGFGRLLFESTDTIEKTAGAFLIVANSVMVVLIGILLRKTVSQYNPPVANIYLVTRVLEALCLASPVASMFAETNLSEDLGYFVGMVVLGLGSLPMCFSLHKHNIAPYWLAIWGVVGYALFSFGFLMELFGKAWSMYLLGPGGLWEITFAVWLIIKGGRYGRTTGR